MSVAILVASKDGAGTVGATVRSAVTQADVYVVSDGSCDETAAVAREAGAHVLELAENIGKPAAIHRALTKLRLPDRYDAIAVLDDDTTIAPDFVARAIEQFRKALAHDPQSAVAHFGLGSSLLQTGDAAAAVAPLERAVALQPRMRQAYYLLGRAYRGLGALERSRQAFARADALAQAERTSDQKSLGIDVPGRVPIRQKRPQ
jgi:predicted Zn-dependent protease